MSQLDLAELSPARQRLALVLVWSCGLVVLAAVIALSWNSNPYWMDAEEYALFLSIGRWAVHPPGYILFMVLARLLYTFGLASPYGTLQVLTLAMTLAGMVLLYRLLRKVIGPLQASILVFTFALSWVPLLINHTGTSSTSDLVTVPFLLLMAVRLSERSGRASATHFASAVAICGGFRLTTLIMMIPLLGAVLWRNRRQLSVWVALAASLLVVGLLQLLTIQVSGGWDMYRHMLSKERFVNSTYIESGVIARALFNLGRTVFWFVLATFGLWFALPRLRSAKPWRPSDRLSLLYGALAALGPFLVCAFYLCEHPGYVASALAGFYLCVAVAWSRADGRLVFSKRPVIAMAASLLIFFGLRYYAHPATPAQVAANGILLQYSADAARHAYFLSTMDWLRIANELAPFP